jgi:hypothetical protein
MKVLIMQFSPPSYYFKYSPRPVVPRHQRPSFTPTQTNGKIIVLYILIFYFFRHEPG